MDYIIEFLFFVGFTILIANIVNMLQSIEEVKKECEYHAWMFKDDPPGLECSACRKRVYYNDDL